MAFVYPFLLYPDPPDVVQMSRVFYDTSHLNNTFETAILGAHQNSWVVNGNSEILSIPRKEPFLLWNQQRTPEFGSTCRNLRLPDGLGKLSNPPLASLSKKCGTCQQTGN